MIRAEEVPGIFFISWFNATLCLSYGRGKEERGLLSPARNPARSSHRGLQRSSYKLPNLCRFQDTPLPHAAASTQHVLH